MVARGRRRIAKDGCCVGADLPNIPPEVKDSLCKVGGLDKVIAAIPTSSTLEEEGATHAALSDPSRLHILHALRQCDQCPCLLKEITHLSDSKLSYHLGVLEEAGLIESAAVRRWRIYTLTVKGRAYLLDGRE